jgi:glycosyltransferase involved in cell wall biosynthesis
MTSIDVIIPALNEEKSLPYVLRDIPHQLIRKIVVSDNGSTDRTSSIASELGAHVVFQPQKGYGSACLKAIDYLKKDPPDIVVFLDGDYSDHPQELISLVHPIIYNNIDLVIGSRTLGQHDQGALLPQAVFGNWLACRLIDFFYHVSFTDLGPFRAIRWSSLMELQMCDPDFGWTVEMQVKASKKKMKVCEVPVSYRKRIGVSKVTGTLRGSIRAGEKILYIIFREIFL